MIAEHTSASLRNGRATSSQLSSTMFKWTTTILAASTLSQSSALVATSGRSYHAVPYVRGHATDSTCSNGGVMSCRSRRNFPPLRSATITTNLYYQQGDQDDSMGRKSEHRDAASRLYSQRFSRWWNSVCHGAESDDSTKHVDEYLEFLDRRYHRLHDKQANKGIKFSALNWLMEKPTVTDDEHGDALFVLGVAGLASERFLERHHIAISRDLSEASAQAVAPTSAVVEAEVVKPSMDVSISSPLFNAARKIGAGRQQLITYQSEQLRSAVALLVKTMVSLPKNVMNAVWNFGGGKKTLTLTCWALVAAVVVVRPVVQALMNQKAMQG